MPIDERCEFAVETLKHVKAVEIHIIAGKFYRIRDSGIGSLRKNNAFVAVLRLSRFAIAGSFGSKEHTGAEYATG